MKYTYTMPVSVKGIVVENGKVWLRKNERAEWELPGGKMEHNEQPEDALVREISEELGFEISVDTILTATVYSVNDSIDEQRGVLVLIYVCKLLQKSGTFEAVGEAGKAEYSLFDPKNLQPLTMPDFYKAAIKKAVATSV